METDFRLAIDKWLKTRKATLWGRAFDVSDGSQTRGEAIEWFNRQLNLFHGFVKEHTDD